MILAGIAGCKKDNGDLPPIPKPAVDTLMKELAVLKNINIGSLFNHSYSSANYKDYLIYNKTISDEFSVMSLEWEFAANEIWTGEYLYDYKYLDKALLFAKEHNMKVRGTHLLWYGQMPGWLENGNYSSDEVKTMLKAYINNLFTHIKTDFPGIMTEVSVANEILRDDNIQSDYGDLRQNFWVEKMGEHYIDSAFVWTSKAYPYAKLLLNEYGNEYNGDSKTKRFIDLITRLKNNNIPVDAVGLQCHFSIHDSYDVAFDTQKFEAAIAKYASLGYEVYLTELDVRINDDQTGESEAKYLQQAALYKKIFQSALKNNHVKEITFWGFNDDLSYLNGSAEWLPQSRDWGLIFDNNYNRKPAYYTIIEALK